MTSINTNVGSLNARASAESDRKMEQAMNRLSSGMRVNSASDDAAGLAVATKMTSQLRGINMSIRNAQDGIGLIQTAESGVNEIRIWCYEYANWQCKWPTAFTRTHLIDPMRNWR